MYAIKNPGTTIPGVILILAGLAWIAYGFYIVEPLDGYDAIAALVCVAGAGLVSAKDR